MRNLTPQTLPHGFVQQDSSSSLNNSNPFEAEGSTGSDSSSFDGHNAPSGSSTYRPVPSDDSAYRTHIPHASPPPPIAGAGRQQANPFDSDDGSMASDQYMYPSTNASAIPSNQYQNHYASDAYYNSRNNSNSNSNSDLLNATSRQLPAPPSAAAAQPNYMDYEDGNPSFNSIAAHATAGAAAAAAGHTTMNQLYSHQDPQEALSSPDIQPQSDSQSSSLIAPHSNSPTHTQQYPPFNGIASPEGMSTAAAGQAAAVAAGAAGSLLALPSSRPSSSSLNAMSGGPANVMSEFDRYPNRVSSAPSIASGSGAPLLMRDGYPQHINAHHHMINGARSSTISNESASSTFSDTDSASYAGVNPFVVNSDFSPFGGYPASSFPLHMEEKEADDYLHNPDPILDANNDRRCQGMDKKGFAVLFSMIFLAVGGLALFVVFPALTFSGATEEHRVVTQTAEVLTNYQYNILGAIRQSLVDPDTPSEYKTYVAKDGSSWNLVFSDEFNMEGRTFYEGDDQFWTAPDFHYAATEDLEWYSPDAVTTEKGALNLRLDAFKNHNLFYRSGMVQSWNKFCFTQGRVIISAMLPGNGSVLGLWPGIWTLGNLVRAGYLATAVGVWPYSYNSCDAGITPNMSSTDGMCFLFGQRLNTCTCPGSDHPNPGTGRGAQEIDVLEGTVDSTLLDGIASQSLQIAPYDIWYYPDLNFIEVYNTSISHLNAWNGGPLQQAISMATALNTTWYEYSPTPNFQTFGFEYLNDEVDGYIRWFVGENPVFTIYAPALGPNGNVDQRLISKEPMSIIMNLGISNSWVYIDWPSLKWPSTMRIDFVRVYQPPNAVNVGCDPEDYPTYKYIQEHLDIYSNPNLTTWDDTDYAWPQNTLTGCS